MMRFLLLFLSSCLFLASCSWQTQRHTCQKQAPGTKLLALQKLKNFSVDSVDIDYVATCKARIVDKGKKYSGSCRMVLTRNHELQLTVFHSLGGTLLEIYADRYVIQVNDFSEKRYYEFSAGKIDNLNIPVFRDLSIIELQSILWGRLTAEAADTLGYELEQGRLKKMFKKNEKLDLIVSYQRWLRYDSLLFPRTLNMANRKEGSSIKIVITDFDPGYACDLTLTNYFAQRS